MSGGVDVSRDFAIRAKDNRGKGPLSRFNSGGGGMHNVWKGAISFGLVSIPVQLFSATQERAVPLRQVHAQDGGLVRYRRVCTVDGAEISYGDVARGYELPNGEVVVLAEKDLAQLPLSSSRVIDVLSFVDADAVDPIQLYRSYYCEPIGSGVTPYVLLREALQRRNRVAVVKITLRQRESLAVIRPRGEMLVLQMLLWPDEVRTPQFTFLDDDVTVRPQELEVAQSYVDALTGDVDHEETVDRYRVALEQLVEAKLAGRVMTQPEASEDDTGGGDLMEALRRSVEEAQRGRDDGARAPARGGSKAKATSLRSAKKTKSKKTKAKDTADRTTATKKPRDPPGGGSAEG